MFSKPLLVSVLTAFLAWGAAAPAWAGPVLGFEGITSNNVADVATGQAQLFVELNPVGGGQVSFRFFNTGPNASSITDIYFDDGTLLGIASIINGTGVSFSQGASPPNLPGGNEIDFNVSEFFLTDSDAPTQPNGVNPDEELTIIFDLIDGQVFQDVLDAIHLSSTNPGVDVTGGLRIGIHVQGFDSDGSESFVNVPEPMSLLLLSVGLIAMALTFRRRRRFS